MTQKSEVTLDTTTSLALLRGLSLRYALLAAVAYTALTAIYIFVSSALAASLTTTAEELARVEIYKGIGFIVVNGVALFLLLRHLFGRLYEACREVVQSRAALAHADQRALTGILAASVAHDVNNMLTVLSFQADLVMDPKADPSGRAEAKAQVDEALDRIRDLVARLRDGWRRGADSDLEETPLEPLLTGAVDLAATHRAVRHATLATEVEPGLRPSVVPALVERALVNFLLNAGEATGGSGRIETRAFTEGSDLALEVHDDGPGVPPEERARIFEPLFTSKDEGNGLGLVSARVCADVHGGRVEVDTSPLGGACFRLVLPLQAESAPQPLRAVAATS